MVQLLDLREINYFSEYALHFRQQENISAMFKPHNFTKNDHR